MRRGEDSGRFKYWLRKYFPLLLFWTHFARDDPIEGRANIGEQANCYDKQFITISFDKIVA